MLSCQYGPESQECFKHLVESLTPRIKAVLKTKRGPTYYTRGGADEEAAECSSHALAVLLASTHDCTDRNKDQSSWNVRNAATKPSHIHKISLIKDSDRQPHTHTHWHIQTHSLKHSYSRNWDWRMTHETVCFLTAFTHLSCCFYCHNVNFSSVLDCFVSPKFCGPSSDSRT